MRTEQRKNNLSIDRHYRFQSISQGKRSVKDSQDVYWAA